MPILRRAAAGLVMVFEPRILIRMPFRPACSCGLTVTFMVFGAARRMASRAAVDSTAPLSNMTWSLSNTYQSTTRLRILPNGVPTGPPNETPISSSLAAWAASGSV